MKPVKEAKKLYRVLKKEAERAKYAKHSRAGKKYLQKEEERGIHSKAGYKQIQREKIEKKYLKRLIPKPKRKK